jgi:hypothetical protein
MPIQECIRRDALREGHERVGEEVIRKTAKQMRSPESRIIPDWTPAPDPANDCIIVDIDGTLSQMADRSPYDESRVYEDTPRLAVLATVKALLAARPNMKLFIFSGRTVQCYSDTSRWLYDKCGLDTNRTNTNLTMRQAGDSRNDAIVKMEMYEAHIKDKYSVLAVFDDRASVIRDCWDKLGLFVFRCGRIDKDGF